MRAISFLFCVIGLILIGLTLTLGKRNFTASHSSPAPVMPAVATAEYGERLMTQTPELIGPDVPDAGLRYSGNRLSCASCHPQAGTQPGSLSLIAAVQNYPKFSARTAKIRTLEDRIDECMMRSMNGKPLPQNSPQMIAMTAWIRGLAARDAAMGESKPKTEELPSFKPPDRTANVFRGQRIFEQRCATCHGYDGSGILASASPLHGYIYPPPWGADSFNTGAGMHRLLTAAPFIKARMPLGRPDLTDDDAYDVASYINAQPRPEMANFEADYPDKRTKPVDAAYPPFADPFPIEQHRLGPFKPIDAYYKQLKTLSK